MQTKEKTISEYLAPQAKVIDVETRTVLCVSDPGATPGLQQDSPFSF